jgi:hypothetical protein
MDIRAKEYFVILNAHNEWIGCQRVYSLGDFTLEAAGHWSEMV